MASSLAAKSSDSKSQTAAKTMIHALLLMGIGSSSEGFASGMNPTKTIPKFQMSKLSPTMQENFGKTFQRLLDGGKRPSDRQMRNRWGENFENNKNILPDLGKGGYKEFRIRSGQSGSENNKYRLVVGKDGNMYYSDTHYGDHGGVPFYQVGKLSKEQTAEIFKNNAKR
jgi:guanyl-specific ribonuclease Sa